MSSGREAKDTEASESVTLKIECGGDLRRIPISIPPTMKRLNKILSKSFPRLDLDSIKILYRDEDGDEVTITRTPELVEAARHVTAVLGLTTLRIKIVSTTMATTGSSSSKNSLSWREMTVSETPRAHFVSDVAIPDGTEVSTSTPFRKVWRIKNPGPSAWPAGVHLVHVGGADFSAHPESVKYEHVAPGADVQVALDLTAPARPGHVRGYWRLSSANGEHFGHRLWADVVVVSSSATPPEEPSAQPQPAVHYRVQCDASGECPIVGPRYHKVGANYDLNAREFAKLPPSEQILFERIDRPSCRPMRIGAAFPAAIAAVASAVASDVSSLLQSQSASAHTDGARRSNVHEEAWHPFGFSPLHGMVSATTSSSRPNFKATFESDVTIPDGTVLVPNEIFTKAWMIRNSGDTTWPVGCKLVHVGQDDLSVLRDGGVDSIPAIPPLGPGDSRAVSIAMSAGDKLGHVRSTWRLEAPNGQRFGCKLWCDVNVVEPEVADAAADSGVEPAVAVAVHVSAPAPPTDAIDTTDAEDALLRKLAEIGFDVGPSDDSKRHAVISIIRMCGGDADLHKVVTRLLELS